MQTKKTRIAYLLTHPIQYQSPLLKRLAAEVDIDVVAFYQSDCSVQEYYDEGFGRKVTWDTPLLDGYLYEFLPAFGSCTALGYWRPFSFGMMSRLRRGKFDVLVVNRYNRPYHWLVMLQARLLGIRVFIRDEATSISKRRGFIRRLLKRTFFECLNVVVEGYLAIGTANAEYYYRNGVAPNRVFMTPYAVDNDFFRRSANAASSKRNEFRAQLNLEPRRPIVLYASKLEKRKCALDLFDAFQLAAEGLMPRPYLLFVGDGELRSALEERIKKLGGDSVRYLGFQNQNQLPAFYDLCEIFVLPSYGETWGLVVNEAMNAGKAVVLSDEVGAGVDLVVDGENGFRVPVGDTRTLADRLRILLANPGLIRRMGMRSAEIIAGWNYEEDVAGLRRAIGIGAAQGGMAGQGYRRTRCRTI